MTLIRCFLLFLYLNSCLFQATAQDPEPSGYNDPVLLNGKLYLFNLPNTTEGNQYLAGTEFVTGTLDLKGFTFTGLRLNYDIYNQQLILKYRSNTGALNRIIISDAWIERFSLNNLNFIFLKNNGRKLFYQVFGDGKYLVLYHWTKTLELGHFHGATNRVFSKPHREMYIFHDDIISEYRNNRGFITLFDKSDGEKIQYYLLENKVKLRKASDSDIVELVSFINNNAK